MIAKCLYALTLMRMQANALAVLGVKEGIEGL